MAQEGGLRDPSRQGRTHRLVRLGDKKTVLPYHGKNRELATGTVLAIKKALDLMDRK